MNNTTKNNMIMEEKSMIENINILIEAADKANKGIKDLNKKINGYNEEASKIYDDMRIAAAGNISAYKELRNTKIEELKKNDNSIKAAREKIAHFENIKNACLWEANNEIEILTLENLAANRDKIENVPARYKKVKDILKVNIEGVSVFYSENCHYIDISIRTESNIYFNQKWCITKGFDDPVINFEYCEKVSSRKTATLEEIQSRVKAYESAKKKLAKLEAQYNAKRNEITSASACNGLSF